MHVMISNIENKICRQCNEDIQKSLLHLTKLTITSYNIKTFFYLYIKEGGEGKRLAKFRTYRRILIFFTRRLQLACNDDLLKASLLWTKKTMSIQKNCEKIKKGIQKRRISCSLLKKLLTKQIWWTWVKVHFYWCSSNFFC